MTEENRVLKTKDFGALRVKNEEQGEVEAVVATLGVVDKDGDVILPGAIPDGAKVKLSAYGHDVVLLDAPPVGKGEIRERNGKAIFSGRFFMETERGAEAFRVVKALGADGEWSIGYLERSVKTVELTDEWRSKGARRVIRSMEPREASPVFMGSQFGTATIAAKADTGSGEEANADEEDGAAVEVSDDSAEQGSKASQNDTREQLRHALIDLEEVDEDGYLYVEDVVADAVIYQMRLNGDESMYRRGFSVDEDGEITLAEERTEVRRETRFVDLDGDDGEEKSASEAAETKAIGSMLDDIDMSREVRRFERNREYAEALEAKRLAEERLELATKRVKALEQKRRSDASVEQAIREEIEKFQRTRRRLAAS